MREYLSPGVYIEEFNLNVKPIESVSTSTAGFVGVELAFPKKETLADIEGDVGGTVLIKLKEIKTKLSEDKVSELVSSVDALIVEIEKLVNLEEKKKALNVLNIVNSVVSDAAQFIVTKSFRDKPTFISSWEDYVSKFGRYKDRNYLAPAICSFFANGGKRCYVVSVKDETSIVGVKDGNSLTGLKCLEKIDEVSILCIPGVTDDIVQGEMIVHCEKKGDRFCILDSEEGENIEAVKMRKNNLVSDKGVGALYYPWIKTAVETKDLEGKAVLENMFMPPSGAIAGIYAKIDGERGVHKSPANVVIRDAFELERSITRAELDMLNPLNINCILEFQGRGIRVWGARTIAPKGSEWKYINVRRLLFFLEESIYESTQWIVFERNNEALWARVTQTISNFLLGIWKSGALVGQSPKEAYFVKCDRSTMTQSDMDNGKLTVVIGVAPTKPAEFVIFRITQFTADKNN